MSQTEPHPQDRGSDHAAWDRWTVRLPPDLVEKIEARVEDGQYLDRSKAIRGLLQEGLRCQE